MIVALAGRRVDAVGAKEPRFPAHNASRVKQQITEVLQARQPQALVCAAACGADILALESAAELGVRRRVVLPFDPATFRASSVIDRGGDWGERYDRILAEVEAAQDLVSFAHDKDNPQTYFNGNLDILAQAEAMAQSLQTQVVALVIWNGTSRGADDVTGHFKQEAESRKIEVVEINTL